MHSHPANSDNEEVGHSWCALRTSAADDVALYPVSGEKKWRKNGKNVKNRALAHGCAMNGRKSAIMALRQGDFAVVCRKIMQY
ncbi:hypothetical protein I6G97_08760 [Edwardsiella hoshinae]|uniref:hypothetical protein n=1 Tax=Edwardsiella hoshinae TaxID=93378 RepID=UPI0011E5A968|nr:hypothetical protein [Edwardsiella hoshinae]QPR29628.1 hypothetical protein I6G97_08760 [Edwardsiella hoshinae]